MPTKQELDDLVGKCDWTWTTTNGAKGYVVRGKGAYASNSIFLPTTGLCSGTERTSAGAVGRYWSSVPYGGNARNLSFDSSGRYTDSYFRYVGQSFRPVQGFTQ